MNASRMNRQGGGMLDGIKSKLGFSADPGYDPEDDYDAYADNYDDYSTSDDERDDYSDVTTRNAGTNRVRHSSYSDRASSDYSERRSSSSSHPPLVSFDDVRSQSSAPRHEASTGRRRTSGNGLGRNSVGRASDFAYSGSEIEQPSYDDGPDASIDPATTADLGAIKPKGGYNSLFDSSPTAAASTPSVAPASSVGVTPRASQSSQASYDPYAAYEGAGSASHKPTRNVVVLAPNSYGEVESVARSLKAGDAVVLSLKNTPSQLSKRILDFSFGVVSALDANVDCVADKVFAITRGVALSDAECLKLRGQGVLS